MCNFPSVVECRPSGLEWNIHLDSFTLFEFTILFINLPIGSWFLNIYSRLLITWTLANLNLAVPRSKKLFLEKSMRKNRSSSGQEICENYDLTHIFSWSLVLSCVGKLIEFLITAALCYVQNTRVIRCDGFRNLSGTCICGSWICKIVSLLV